MDSDDSSSDVSNKKPNNGFTPESNTVTGNGSVVQASEVDQSGNSQSGEHDAPTKGPSNSVNSNKRKLPKILVGAIAAVVLLVGGSAAAYFGYVVPNKPENIWKTGLDRSADAYDEVLEYFDGLEDSNGFKSSGNIKLSGSFAADGSFESISDKKNSKSKLDFGFAGGRYELELLTHIPDNATTPDIYIKPTGIRGLSGLLAGSPYESVSPVINELENKWIFIDHTFIDQLLASSMDGSGPDLNQQDFTEIARAFGEVNREYLFTTETDRRVLIMAEQVGKEQRDDRDTYKFKVSYDKENLKKYLQALKDKLKETKFRELLEASGQSYDKAFDLESSFESIDELKGDETADVWVDMDTKLIRYIRVSDNDSAGYLEIGFPYNGGDEVPVSIIVDSPDDNSDLKFSLSVNRATDVITSSIEINIEDSGGVAQNVSGNLTIERNSDAVEFNKPDDTIPVTELVSMIFGGLLGGEPVLPSTTEAPSSEIEL